MGIHIMPHPTNNHAPLPSFLELSLEDAKAEDVQGASKDLQTTSKGPELTTEPFSRLRDELALLHRPFLGRGRVGKQNLRRNASSSSKYYQDLLRLLQTNLLCEELTP